MVLKPDQQRIKDLLSETITLICRSGLHFKSEFSIEALIGITLDQEDVFLVSIKETVHRDEAWTQSPSWLDRKNADSRRTHNSSERLHGDKEQSADYKHKRQADVQFKETLTLSQDFNRNLSCYAKTDCRRVTSESTRHPNHKRLRKDPAPKSYVQENLVGDVSNDEQVFLEQKSKRQRLGGSLEMAGVQDMADVSKDSSTLQDHEEDCLKKPVKSSYVGTSSEGDDVFEDTSNVVHVDRSANCNGANIHDKSDTKKLCQVINTCSDDEDSFKKEIMFVKKEPNDASFAVSRRQTKLPNMFGQSSPGRASSSRRYASRGSTVGIMHPLVVQQTDARGVCSSWQLSATKESQASSTVMPRWMSGMMGGDAASSETQGSSKADDSAPEMTPEQALMAVEVLSISGSFINIGSAKAFQHNLRKLTKSELSEVLEKMTVPASNNYCVGLLCTEGASRVFYKIPPPLIKEEALSFYNMDLSVYSNLYYGPVRVPHNVKEPYEWKCMLEMKSPFNMMTVDSGSLP